MTLSEVNNTCAAIIAAQAWGATLLLEIGLVPQLLLNGCADACAASILANLSVHLFLTLHSSPSEAIGSTCPEHSLSKRWQKSFLPFSGCLTGNALVDSITAYVRVHSIQITLFDDMLN